MISSEKVLDFKCKDLKLIKTKFTNKIPLKLFQIAAGKAQIHFDEMEKTGIDLKEHLVRNPKHTHAFSVISDSLEPEVRKGDLLIIDQKPATLYSKNQLNGRLAACVFEGESIVKRYKFDGKNEMLLSGNTLHKPIKIQEFHSFQLWGICTFIIREADLITWNNPAIEKYNALKEIDDIISDFDLAPDEKCNLIAKIVKKFKIK